MKLVIAFSLLLCIASAFENRGPRNTQRERLGSMVQKEDVRSRIANGQTAAANQFPFQAGLSLFYGEDWAFGGGSLISKEWVLTSAACTLKAISVTVYLGSITRLDPIVRLQVDRCDIKVHEAFDEKTLINDISLIKIPAVTYSAAIQPVALPKCASSYSTYVDETVVASGWGRTSERSTTWSPVLQFAYFKVISNELCAEEYNDIDTGMLCTLNINHVGTCDGDAGGPLVLASSKVQIGIISFSSRSECDAGYPEGNTRVTSYLDWIRAKTGLRLN